jgi:hypothetical protein
MVSHVQIRMVILIDAGTKTPNPQLCRMYLKLLQYPLRHGLYQERLCEALLSIVQTLQ